MKFLKNMSTFLHIQHPQRRHAILKYLIPTIDLENITTNFEFIFRFEIRSRYLIVCNGILYSSSVYTIPSKLNNQKCCILITEIIINYFVIYIEDHLIRLSIVCNYEKIPYVKSVRILFSHALECK